MIAVEAVGNCLGIDNYIIPFHSIISIFMYDKTIEVLVTPRAGAYHKVTTEAVLFTEENDADTQKTFSLIKEVLGNMAYNGHSNLSS